GKANARGCNEKSLQIRSAEGAASRPWHWQINDPLNLSRWIKPGHTPSVPVSDPDEAFCVYRQSIRHALRFAYAGKHTPVGNLPNLHIKVVLVDLALAAVGEIEALVIRAP